MVSDIDGMAHMMVFDGASARRGLHPTDFLLLVPRARNRGNPFCSVGRAHRLEPRRSRQRQRAGQNEVQFTAPNLYQMAYRKS